MTFLLFSSLLVISVKSEHTHSEAILTWSQIVITAFILTECCVCHPSPVLHDQNLWAIPHLWNETIDNHSWWHFHLHLHVQLTLHKSVYYFASDPLSQKRNQVFKSIDQTLDNSKYEFKNLCRDFPGGAVVENPPANAGDTGSNPGLGRSHMLRSN